MPVVSYEVITLDIVEKKLSKTKNQSVAHFRGVLEISTSNQNRCEVIHIMSQFSAFLHSEKVNVTSCEIYTKL